MIWALAIIVFFLLPAEARGGVFAFLLVMAVLALIHV